MKFQITFEITPGGPFGVPEDGRTVLPALSGEYVGDTYHTRTMTRVGYGILPYYRRSEEAIDQTLNFHGLQGRLKDNFVFLDVDAETSSKAYELAVTAIDAFLQHLALSQRRPFSCKALYLESSDGRVYPTPKYITLASVTHYNLERLRQDIQEAQFFASLKDLKLERSLQYFEHAIFLYERRGEITDVLSRHYRYLIAAIFLNLWKAVSTIVGDPSVDQDYQRRYRKYGFDLEFFQQKIERLRSLRNDYDVAHYYISPDRIEEIEKNYGEAQSITVEVLTRYREHVAGILKGLSDNELPRGGSM